LKLAFDAAMFSCRRRLEGWLGLLPIHWRPRGGALRKEEPR
jgi:hypothetical protein